MSDKKSIKWLYKRSKKQHFNIAMLILTNAVFSVLSVLFALTVKYVVDGAVSGDRNKLLYGSIVIVVVVLLQFLFRILNKSIEEYIGARLEISLRSYIFSKIFKKKYEKICRHHSGELMNNLSSDVTVVSEGITQILPVVLSAIVRLICSIVALLMIDAVFALAFLIAGLMVFGISSFMRVKIKYFHKKSQETGGKVRAYMQENIENVLAVKVFSGEDKVVDRADKLQEENFKIRMKKRNYSVMGHSTFHFIASAGYVFALIYGGIIIFNGGSLSYGDLSAILQLVNNVQMPFMTFSMVIPKFFSMISSAERLIEVEEIEEEPPFEKINAKETYASMQKIEFESLKFAYDRDVVLDGLSLTVNKGEIVAITGTSGIGKSTLFKLLLGVYGLNDGKITITTANEEINVGESTRTLFSYVPQGNMLFSGTIRENLLFINPEADEELLKKAIKISEAEGFISELPLGIDTVIGEKGHGLSEGQLQRLALARAILSNAPIMLLDEATSALDEKTERKVLENLKRLSDVTVLIVTHKKAALDFCDKKIEFQGKE